jgi:8-hydroxy-5-deazaflavin:NADPH oxidoreductase
LRFGILGSGIVGRTIGARLVELGHDVTIGTRDVASTLARTEPDIYGNPPLRVWQHQHPQVRLGTFADAATSGAVVVNATNGAANLDGKVLIDIANPLDFSQGMPHRCSFATRTRWVSRSSALSPMSKWSRPSTP